MSVSGGSVVLMPWYSWGISCLAVGMIVSVDSVDVLWVWCLVGWWSILLQGRSSAIYVVRGLSCCHSTTSLRCECGVWAGVSVHGSCEGSVVRALGSLVHLRQL